MQPAAVHRPLLLLRVVVEETVASWGWKGEVEVEQQAKGQPVLVVVVERCMLAAAVQRVEEEQKHGQGQGKAEEGQRGLQQAGDLRTHTREGHRGGDGEKKYAYE